MDERYSKQMNFKGIGKEGQRLLANGRALIVGCGALGTVVANSLVRTGVGFIRLVDRDFVEKSNLHRQILFDEEDAEKSAPKAEVAKNKLQTVNSLVNIEAVVKDVNSITIDKFTSDIDIIIDCTDNFKTRYLINDLSFSKGIPWIYGGAVGSTGVVKSFIPGEGGCLRCMMDTPPPTGSFDTCDTAGVINTVTGIVGMLQSNEAIKFLTGNKEDMESEMIFLDLWDNVYEKVQLPKLETCSCCGKKDFQYLQDKKPEASFMCGNKSVQVDPHGSRGNISLEALSLRLSQAGIKTRLTPFILNIWVDNYEIKLFDDGRAIIKNVDTIDEAKGIYSRYIGY
ncbi:ThiF family adenylyltransferase [Alkaliphilus serpentinus]|uniref:Thiazole biosynthesis adenylyltransferase ThiF n=1 Tax=Alkaliphilus serpentinus TaxID=1482731 RepID=A0A833HQD7_9FIRM|nr:ThiF family adenylyltransferase [Alkaliphilus serpentinus]KAB3531799.1 thiazole biosynthesis adenylyltransferase ThiF [Alkaliphilus serpentinus]